MKAKGALNFGSGNISWPGNRQKEKEQEKKPEEEEQAEQKGGETGEQEAKKEEDEEQKKIEEGGEEKKEGEEGDDEKIIDELVKKLKPKEKSDTQKINELVKKSKNILTQISSHSLFGLSSRTLTVDETKVTITIKEFLGTEQIYSIPLKELQDVAVETSLFGSTLKIIDKRYKDKPIIIKGLQKDEAFKARRMIQGLMLSTEQKIDVSKLSPAEAAIKIAELGKAKNAE